MTESEQVRHMTASERFAALHPHLQKCAEHIDKWDKNYDYCAWVEVERRAAFTRSPSGFTKDGWYEARELYLAMQQEQASDEPEKEDQPSRIDIIGQNGNDGLHYGTGEVGVPGVLAGPDQHIAGSSALHTQVGGSHYKDMTIQPVEYIHANNLGFCEGAVVKYVSRWRSKNGIKDLEKARHFIDLLIELETKREGE